MTDIASASLRETMVHVKPVTLREQVYDQIRQAIFERTLKPGDHIQERELTPLLNTSRTPLREALGLLERDGLVQYVPNRGWFVTKYTPPEIKEIFAIRCGLENLGTRIRRVRFPDHGGSGERWGVLGVWHAFAEEV